MQLQAEHTEDMEHLNRLRERKVLRCAIYIRVSTAEQRIEGWSLQAQEAGLRQVAESKGWKVVGVYADEGKTARKRLKERKEIHRLLADVKAGLIDMILFKELDRWMRNLSDFYKVQDVLDAHGVEWFSQQQPGLEMRTKEGRLQVNVLLSVGQNETDTTSDRIVYTNKYLVKQKRWPGGARTLPRGYTLDEDHRVIIDPVHGDYMRNMVDRVIQYGSVRRALLECNAETEKPMNYNNMLRHLTNPMLYGLYQDVPDFVEKPFITKERFDLLQSNIRRNARNGKSHFKIFAGMLVCNCCGKKLAANRTQRPNKAYISYRCNYHIMKACTNRYSINEEKLEKMLMVYVREAVAETIAEVERIEHERKLKPKKKNNRAAIEKQLEKLEDVYIDSPTMTKEKYEKRKAAILAKLVEDEPEEKLPELADLEKVKAIFESNIEEVYETFTREERREFWRGILDHIVIEGKEIKSVGFLE